MLVLVTGCSLISLFASDKGGFKNVFNNMTYVAVASLRDCGTGAGDSDWVGDGSVLSRRSHGICLGSVLSRHGRDNCRVARHGNGLS